MDENLTTTTVKEIEEKSEPRPSIRAASGLYLLSLVLVAVGGSLVQMVSVPWGLIVTEILLIFLPAWAYLRWRKLPVAATVRWRWPGGRVVLVTILIGLSLFQFVSWLSTLLLEGMNYSEKIYAGIMPKGLIDSIVLLVGMAILAPLCEEFLFRGVIQRAYERHGVIFAILLVAVMFSFYHLSFLRFVGILPFALVICWMFWRSDSLVTSVLLHFSYNLFAPVMMLVGVVWPGFPLEWVGTLPVALTGLGVALVLLIVFWRITPRRERPLAPAAAFGLRQAWPLIPAALIILLMASIEMYVARHPELLDAAQGIRPLTLTPPQEWSQPASWRYAIYNQGSEEIGQATCQRSAAAGEYRLDCQFDHQKAYQIQQGNSYFQDGIHQETVHTSWNASNLSLITWQSDLQGEGYPTSASAIGNSEALSLTVVSNGTAEAPLVITPATLLPGEWPWRLSALPFKEGLKEPVVVAYPLRWSEAAQESISQTEEHLVNVAGQESVDTPAGTFEAWKVTVGDETAWYRVEAPHIVVKYDNGMNTYLLTESR